MPAKIISKLTQILIIQTASIGDVILATPLIESISQADANIKIDFLLRAGCQNLFQNHPHIRKVMVWDKSQKKYARLWQILRNIRKTNYDYVINLQRFASTGLVTGFSKGRVKIGFQKNPFSFLFTTKVPHHISTTLGLHEIDRNLKLIQGIFEPLRTVKLYPTPNDFAKTAMYKTKAYITIAPASLWETKKYPEEKWVAFINHVPAALQIYLTGGKSDTDLCNRIAQKCVKHSIENLSGKLSLLETATLMKDAHMNYTNDSAPQHLASALNAPVASIFCSTVPAFGFGPLSEKSFVIETCTPLYCRPCGIHGYKTCPEKHFKCAYEIHKEQLLICLPN
ncbi:MAG: glycosyltransferase family 9 protein [Bacteroidota bacterium]